MLRKENVMVIGSKKINNITWTDLLVFSAWIYGGLLYFVNIAVFLITDSQLLADIVIFTYFALLIILSFGHWGHKIQISDIVCLFILLLIVLISYFFNEDNRENILLQLPELFLNVIPFYVVGLIIKQERRTFDLLCFGSAAVIIVNWMYVFLILGTGRQMQEDNLFISYSVLPHTLMLLWYAFDKKRLHHIALAALGVIFLLSMGSRGPVLSTIVFIMLYLIYNSRGRFVKRFFTVILPITIVGVIIISGAWEDVLLWLRDIIIDMNLSTRVIDSILFDAGEGSNEMRMGLYKTLLEHIEKRPFFGYGIYGDWNIINYSSHQMVLELWIHYGVILGSVLLLSGLWIIFRGFRKKVSRSSQVFIIIMISYALVRGLYTGTYLSDYIFMMLGFSVAAGRIKNNLTIDEEV